LLIFCLTAAVLLFGTSYVTSVNVSANHPVLVEGNCDSPVPGTTLVTPAGTCGDFDGDGRIGTAEDTDGADRIFGTIRAAMGPGTGAAAGTGANWNGNITIVKSGRFAEQIFIGQSGFIPGEGTATPGNVTLQAAPGVEAIIDAVLQGDPAGGNTARQAGIGIYILYEGNNVVTLRNLTVRNFAEGVAISLNAKVVIDNCRFENNQNHGVHSRDFTKLVMNNSTITGTGHRIPVSGPPSPGNGLTVDGGQNAQARLTDCVISHNFGAGIYSGFAAPNIVLYKVSTYFNNPDIAGTVTIAPDPNYSN
jgi:hypothetical protein